MSAESQLYSTLLASAPVIAVVGADPDARIYPDFLSQELELPAIVTQRADSEYVNTIHSGAVVASRITMDTWCLAATRIAAEDLADLVEAALPDGEFLVVGRRPEFDPETLTYASIVTSVIWT